MSWIVNDKANEVANAFCKTFHSNINFGQNLIKVIEIRALCKIIQRQNKKAFTFRIFQDLVY